MDFIQLTFICSWFLFISSYIINFLIYQDHKRYLHNLLDSLTSGEIVGMMLGLGFRKFVKIGVPAVLALGGFISFTLEEANRLADLNIKYQDLINKDLQNKDLLKAEFDEKQLRNSADPAIKDLLAAEIKLKVDTRKMNLLEEQEDLDTREFNMEQAKNNRSPKRIAFDERKIAEAGLNVNPKLTAPDFGKDEEKALVWDKSINAHVLKPDPVDQSKSR